MEVEPFPRLPSGAHYPPLRYCFVPSCKNTSHNNPTLIYVPVKASLKKEWCRIVGRECPKSQLYCCELHLDLKTDLQNYDKWKTNNAYPIMCANATLKKFSKVIPHIHTDEMEKSKFEMTIHQVSVGGQCTTKNVAIQVNPIVCDMSTNVKKPLSFKQKKHGTKSTVYKRFLMDEETEETMPSQSGSTYECPTSSTVAQCVTFDGRQHILNIIAKYPKTYLGLPKKFYFLIEHIAQEYKGKTNALEIIITLFKIRQNHTLSMISHLFQVSKSRLQKIFYANTVILASFFKNFIFLPNSLDIKRNLPYAFKIRYSNVQCIIDCFEVEIERPKDPIKQALTWSQYKSCNTIKYLVGATPDGLISFISLGYGGRISDKAITEACGFIDALPTNAVVMADRGFKEIQALLSTKNIKLLRPPSVFSNVKPTKEQVMETKVIASLRVHIERVIRRIREFKILKPHSVIHYRHVSSLDEYVVIACGLINLQNPIIKQC